MVFFSFFRRHLAVLLLPLLLGGCAGLLPGAGPAPNMYNLTPKNTFPQGMTPVRWQLVIEEPLAAGGLDTNRIALRPRPTELKYFAGSRWTERAPRMVQTLIVESFENTNAITAVGRQAIGLRADYSLKTEMREFQAEYFNGSGRAPRIRVRLNAKLVRKPRENIVASRTFEKVVTAEGTNMQAIVLAFDEALGKVIKQLVIWTLREGEADWQRHQGRRVQPSSS